MPTAFEVDLRVSYGYINLVTVDDASVDIDATRAGQPFGIAGAAVPGVLALVVGTNHGTVAFVVTIDDEEPALDDSWEDVVEMSFEPEDDAAYLMTFDDSMSFGLPEATTYRARYCVRGMDAAHDYPEPGSAPDRYLLSLWPAPFAAPVLVREGSNRATYWRENVRAPLPPVAPPARLITVRTPQRLPRDERPLPAGLLDVPGADEIARLDQDLIRALGYASPERLRDVTLWMCERACGNAFEVPYDSWQPAVTALRSGAVLPSPFNDLDAARAALAAVTRRGSGGLTFTRLSDGSPPSAPPVAPVEAALATLLAATDPDPLAAACGAVAHAASGTSDIGQVVADARMLLR